MTRRSGLGSRSGGGAGGRLGCPGGRCRSPRPADVYVCMYVCMYVCIYVCTVCTVCMSTELIDLIVKLLQAFDSCATRNAFIDHFLTYLLLLHTYIHRLIAIHPIYPDTSIQYKYKICNTDPPHQLGFCHISVTTYENPTPFRGSTEWDIKEKHTELQAYIHTYIPVRLSAPAAAEPPRRWWTTPRSCIHPTVVVGPADLLAGTSARLCCCHHRGSARRPAPSPSLWPPVPPGRTRSPRWRCY